MRSMALAPLLLLALGWNLSSCMPPVGANCNEALDGLTTDEAKELLEPELTSWSCTDPPDSYDPEVVVFSMEVEIDGQDYSDEPYCVCAIEIEDDPATVHDCQMTMDSDEKSEIWAELCQHSL